MGNDSLLSTTRIYEYVSDSTKVHDNFLNSTEIYGNLFNSTQIYDNLVNGTQIYGDLVNGTQMYESELNSSQRYENILNCTETTEEFVKNDSICTWMSSPYSSSWDMILTTEVVVNSIVCLLGILGNIYAIAIIFRLQLDTFVQKWRKSMAICDLLLLSCDLNQVTVARIARSFLVTHNHSISPYSYVWVLLYPLRKMVETISAWITVSVVIERCVFLWRPSKALSLCRYRTSEILFLFITIFVTSINFPRFREYKVRKCYDAEFNICSHEIRKTDASEVIQNYRNILDWIYVSVTYLVPFLILIILNTFLWMRVRKYEIDQEKLKEIEPELNSVRMIILFVLLFCVCRFPKMVEGVYANEGITVESMSPFSNLMLSINSAVNFIIYMLF